MLAKILPPNMGSADRTIRILLGLILLSITVLGPKTAWGYVGVLLLLTGVVGSCPLYAALGLSSRVPRHTHSSEDG